MGNVIRTKNKIWVVFALGLMWGNILAGQSRHLRLGDEEFEALAYVKAIPHYKKAVKKSEEGAQSKLAHCYYLIHDYESASEEYEKLFGEVGEKPDHAWFEYGHVLLQQGKYDRAKDVFATYKDRVPDDPRGQRFVDALSNRDFWYRDTAAYQVMLLPVNSDASEFGAFPYGEGIVFASSRKAGTRDYQFEGLGEGFLDLYYAKEKDKTDNKWKSPEALGGDIRTKFHESSFSVAESDSTTGWFTRNSEPKGKRSRKETRFIHLDIYHAKMKGNKGDDVEKFEHNQEESNSTHPFISSDGKQLFFSSDREGGFGGKDLYRSMWDGSSWSTPVNLGEKINTPGDEQFPFLHPDGTFFFASDGHPGFGHLDIFKVKDLSEEPINLGAPVNSSFDDFAFYLELDKDFGYFSSNRPGGKGSDDIYSFILSQPTIEIYVQDSVSAFPVEGAEVVLYNESDQVVQRVQTDSLGLTSLELNRESSYKVAVKTPDFEDVVFKVDPNSESTGIQESYRIVLYNPPPAITAMVVDDSLKTPLQGATVSLRRIGRRDTTRRETDRYGRFSAKLRPKTEYELSVAKEGYFTAKMRISTTKDSYDGDTIIPLQIKPVEIGEIFTLQNIYFDFDKWNLKLESEAELSRLVTFLNDNPDVSIELGSHTDARGSADYNEDLSAKRARSVQYFLVLNGIETERITSKGYGESKPVNRCRDGINCSEAEHAENRRTEFTIIGYDGEINQ